MFWWCWTCFEYIFIPNDLKSHDVCWVIFLSNKQQKKGSPRRDYTISVHFRGIRDRLINIVPLTLSKLYHKLYRIKHIGVLLDDIILWIDAEPRIIRFYMLGSMFIWGEGNLNIITRHLSIDVVGLIAVIYS